MNKNINPLVYFIINVVLFVLFMFILSKRSEQVENPCYKYLIDHEGGMYLTDFYELADDHYLFIAIPSSEYIRLPRSRVIEIRKNKECHEAD